MRYAEIINEKVLRINNPETFEDVVIYTNPNKKLIISLMEKFKELRCIWYNNILYVWNAYDLIHDDIIQELDIIKPKEYDIEMYLFYKEEGDEHYIYLDSLGSATRFLKDSSYINRTFLWKEDELNSYGTFYIPLP